MRKTSTNSVVDVKKRGSAFRNLYRLLALLSVIFFATEIGSCGDTTKTQPAGSSIALIDDNPSSAAINIKDQTQSDKSTATTKLKSKTPKVVLNVDSTPKSSPISNTPIAPPRLPQLPTVTSISSVSKITAPVLPKPQPIVKPVVKTTIEPKTQSPVLAANSSSEKTANKKALFLPFASSDANPSPNNKQTTQIVAIQTVPSNTPSANPKIAATTVSLSVNPQTAPAPAPQIAYAPAIHPILVVDSESKKDNGQQPNQTLPPAQEPQPLPQPPSIDGSAPQANITTPAAPANQSTQTLGEAPPDTSLEFLRKEAVLLKPCEWQLDIGFAYLVSDRLLTTIIPPSTIADIRLRQRLLTMPLEFRYGLTERIQLFANMPFGWANTENSFTGFSNARNNGGIGDANVGATFLLHKSDGTSCSPDVITTFGMTAPTGNGNALIGLISTPSTTLGQGFWAGYWNVLAIHKYDPVVVFYGVGSRHYFSRDIEGFTGAKPGDQYIYQLGTGFAINERITLSTIFFGSFITEAQLNDQFVPGTILEPMYVRFATTVTRTNHRIIEPFVEIGLTDDSANARAGITWTF